MITVVCSYSINNDVFVWVGNFGHIFMNLEKLQKMAQMFDHQASHDNEYIREDDHDQDDFEHGLERWIDNNLGTFLYPASPQDLFDVKKKLRKEYEECQYEDHPIPYSLEVKMKMTEAALERFYSHQPPYDKHFTDYDGDGSTSDIMSDENFESTASGKSNESHSSNESLPNDGVVEIVNKLANDFNLFVNEADPIIPNELTYSIVSSENEVEKGIRKVAMEQLTQPLVKLAFDTRRINQETDRNPRTNLQYWHRSDEFITQEQQKKINVFAKLYNILEDIKETYGSLKEWHESYVRVLYDNVSRTLRIKQADSDIFGPQLSYLEQLLYARYRLSLDQVESLEVESIADTLLSKDENLLKRGIFFDKNNLSKNSHNEPASLEIPQAKSFVSKTAPTPVYASAPNSNNIPEIHNHIVIDGKTNQDSLNSLLSAATLVRKNDEKVIERTITIKIRDEVID